MCCREMNYRITGKTKVNNIIWFDPHGEKYHSHMRTIDFDCFSKITNAVSFLA